MCVSFLCLQEATACLAPCYQSQQTLRDWAEVSKVSFTQELCLVRSSTLLQAAPCCKLAERGSMVTKLQGSVSAGSLSSSPTTGCWWLAQRHISRACIANMSSLVPLIWLGVNMSFYCLFLPTLGQSGGQSVHHWSRHVSQLLLDGLPLHITIIISLLNVVFTTELI